MKVTVEYYKIEIMPDGLNCWIPCLNEVTLFEEEFFHLSDALKEYKRLIDMEKISSARHCKYRIVRKTRCVNF